MALQGLVPVVLYVMINSTRKQPYCFDKLQHLDELIMIGTAFFLFSMINDLMTGMNKRIHLSPHLTGTYLPLFAEIQEQDNGMLP